MKKYYPSFYHTSSCFAGHCPDTCCAGWEIPLSEQDKERFRTFIPADYFSDGIIAIDEKGDSCFKLSGGSCPFLNRENLCRIRLDFSHELTPDVCRQYPLFIEEYDTFTECCPSLSCPSVCESIFAQRRLMPVFPDPDYNGEDEFLNSLILTRSKVLSFIERAEQSIDEKKALELEKKLAKNKFDLNDLLDQFDQIEKMGSLKDTIKMIPGIGGKIKDEDIDENAFSRCRAIIYSMTPQERTRPEIINPSRKRRIAAGCGMKVEDVNKLLAQFKNMQKMMKQFGGKSGGKMSKKMRRMMKANPEMAEKMMGKTGGSNPFGF